MEVNVNQTLAIECEWTDPVGESIELAETAATIDISLGDRHITRAENDFSKTVSNRSLLSAYPLALWLANSWWRLRWETTPPRTLSSEWRMSHELPAAGGGFVWPRVIFESDSESIRLRMRPSPYSPFEPVRYLEDLHGWITGHEFERAVSTFLDLVSARLTERGLRNTQLQLLWSEVTAERADPVLTRFRRVEAILGFDPGTATDDLVTRFITLSETAGLAASEEIAHAAAGQRQRAEHVLTEFLDAIDKVSLTGKFQISATPETRFLPDTTPWKRGYEVAQRIRENHNLGIGTLNDKTLASLLGLKKNIFRDDVSAKPPVAGITVRGVKNDQFFFRRKHRRDRRFEAARMLSDHLLAPDSDTWLIETDAHTARQQAQRAFAAEFLCPIVSLQEYLDGDISDTRIEEAADNFEVSDFIVRRQLFNNRVPGSNLIIF